MKSNKWEILCIIIATLLFLSSIGMVGEAKRDKNQDPNEGKGPKKPWCGIGKNKDNQEPVVTIVEPSVTYVEGDTLLIMVTVEDEDPLPIPTILVDMQPTFATGNTVIIDISEWETHSQHIITAAYMDSGGKTGGDDILVTKL